MTYFPVQIIKDINVNPEGANESASGYYRSYITQQLANMFPQWMHIRENTRSVGQQFMSPSAMALNELEEKMDDVFKSKFLSTAPVNEIDILYRTKLPSNLNLTDMSASGVRCIAAPSGCSPSGVDQLWLNQISDLERFYYHVLPTRLEVVSSGNYVANIGTVNWHAIPSGVLDLHQKYVDFWKVEHELTWAYADNAFRKQDRESMEDYETYEIDASGTPTDLYFYDDMLWWLGKDGSRYYLHISNPKTTIPKADTLDLLASFDITSAFEVEPSGIIIDDERTIWVCDTTKTWVYQIKPRYDYFILDKNNRYVYFREDYTDSGVFISNN